MCISVCACLCMLLKFPSAWIFMDLRNCMSIYHTIDAMFAANAAAVVKDVKNVALPAVAIVYRVFPLISSIWSAWRNTLINTNTSSTPEKDNILYSANSYMQGLLHVFLAMGNSSKVTLDAKGQKFSLLAKETRSYLFL